MLRMLRRDMRAGELTVLGLALLLAVAALGSVSLLGDRVAKGVALESRRILGGDVLMTADHPWQNNWLKAARDQGLLVAESIGFPSMVSGSGDAVLADVKAVSDNYPLRGRLRTATVLNGADAEVAAVPAPGTVWLDERLMAGLGAQVGDAVRLGTRTMTVTAVLTQEPDRGFNVFAIAPRLMFNRQDLDSTGLIGFGSRVSYRLHLAGEDRAVAAFNTWANAHLGRGEKLETLDNARPEVRNVLERADRFLRLAALLAVVLAAVAMGLAADRYMRRHLDACAVLRCLGASGGQVVLIHGGEFLLFGTLVTLLGACLGYGAQALLAWLLSALVGSSLPAPGFVAWGQTILVGLVLVAGFALPPLLRLRKVPTVRVLRREWDEADGGSLTATLAGIIALAALMRWIAGDWMLWAIVLGGFAAALLVYGAVGWGFLRLLRKLGRHGKTAIGPGLGWRYGVANLNRHVRATLVQVVTLGLALTALLLLTVARGDLMGAWQSRVPADAPNRFVINIQPDQRANLEAFFVAQTLPKPVQEPMVRGRLVAVNGKPITADSYPEDQAKRLVEREFNLSWNQRLPPGNTVSAGQWHGQSKEPQLSVEQGLATTLGLKLGDVLSYDIGGNRLEAPITSLRKLDWDSMRVNFFVMTPPGVLDNYPASYITSFYLPLGRQDFVASLVREFPNLTLIDVAAVVHQLQDTLDQVARAVQVVFGFALLAGLIVLYGALQATADERSHELAILRALGGQSKDVRRVLTAEFLLLGACAGALAGMGATLLATVLARQVFHLAYIPDPLLPLTGLVAGVAIVLSAGLWGTRGARRNSPLQVLREA
ncbi:MAG TPA: FtsX-like permease family protein [Rhodocyclaceae bacterium]